MSGALRELTNAAIVFCSVLFCRPGDVSQLPSIRNSRLVGDATGCGGTEKRNRGIFGIFDS